MTTSTLSRLLDVTKALGSPLRVRMLAVLEGRELCVGQLAAVFDIARSTASEQLAELRRGGLVSERRAGRFVWYRLAPLEESSGFGTMALRALAGDPQVARDAQTADEILSLPHELVCELGRQALTAARTAPETSRPEKTTPPKEAS